VSASRRPAAASPSSRTGASGSLVAVVEKRGKFWAAEPHFPPPRSDGDGPRSRGGARRLVLASNRVADAPGQTARAGDLVVVRMQGRGSGARARIVRVLGRPDVARDAIEGLMIDRGLARAFDAQVEREARQARDRSLQSARAEVAAGRRRDLRELPTFTIDPITAKDFDDAISAEPLGSSDAARPGVRVWVHIADVSAHVPEGSLVDRQARERSTSVYVPGAVEPMLPEALSNDACSLVSGADRPAVTVELELYGADVGKATFYRSLIRSDERLTYERVDDIFAGHERALEPWGAPLRAAREAATALGQARLRDGGALTLDSSEPEFAFDADGHVSEVSTRAQTESHRLIEQLMIAANEAVARLLAERGVPCLYRVHQRPDPERVKRLIEQLATLDVPTPPVPKNMSSSQAAELMGEISRRIERHVRAAAKQATRRARGGSAGATSVGPSGGRAALTSLLLRTLQQAYYSPKNVGHAGLASTHYCHFTSPIRRYPDLVCHRALLSTVGGDEHAPHVGTLGEWTSERERYAMRIERDADDIARCFALEQALYAGGWQQSFPGEVVGLISAGAFVAFGAPGGSSYEGMLPVRRMRSADVRDWWELNEQGTILQAERSGATLRLGGSLDVRVARVDTVRGRVDLTPAE
jgi:ribonuclease R